MSSAESQQAGGKGDRSGPEAGRMQGHWLFAKLGKRILRPGGRLLTARLLEQAKPASSDDIVELGPGVGATAEVLLRSNPRTYPELSQFSDPGFSRLLLWCRGLCGVGR